MLTDTTLTIDQYQKGASETAIYPGKGEVMGLAYTILGLTGEAGEVANKVKKILRDSEGKITDEAKTKIREELGGVFWYLAQAATELGVPLSEIARENLDILAKRKAEGKIKGSGDDRGTTRDAHVETIHDVDPGPQTCLKCGHEVFDPSIPRHAENAKIIEKHGPAAGYSGFSGWCGCKDVPPVDRTQRVSTSSKPVTMDHPAPGPIDPETGQHEAYWILAEEERKKGFVRPIRRSYVHDKCGTVTSMGQAIAETYARDPKFYTHTFCCECRDHLPIEEFVWDGTSLKVGS